QVVLDMSAQREGNRLVRGNTLLALGFALLLIRAAPFADRVLDELLERFQILELADESMVVDESLAKGGDPGASVLRATPPVVQSSRPGGVLVEADGQDVGARVGGREVFELGE